MNLSSRIINIFSNNNIVTDSNIQRLIHTYLNDRNSLPQNMRDISTWDTSRVTNMSNLILNDNDKQVFNENINN